MAAHPVVTIEFGHNRSLDEVAPVHDLPDDVEFRVELLLVLNVVVLPIS